MYITIRIEKKKEMQDYIDTLLQDGWKEVKQIQQYKPKIRFYILQK